MNWIKVTTQLPEEGQPVIFYFEHTGVGRGRFTMTEYGPCFYGKGGWLTDDVTHWMPDDGRWKPAKLPK